MTFLVIRRLQNELRRLGATAGVLAIVLMLLFVMTGLVGQFNAEPELTTEQIGGDRSWVVSAAGTGPLTTPIPDGRLADVDGMSIVLGQTSLSGERSFIVGSPNLEDGPVLSDGRVPMAAGELLVDASTGTSVGDDVQLGGGPATVVGVTNDATILAGVPLVFTTIDYAQAILSGGEDVRMGVLVDSVPTELDPALKVMTASEVAADGRVPLENAISTVTIVTGLLWMITVIVVAAVTYVSAVERTKEFAVLKAIGASSRRIGASMAIEAVAVVLVAVVIGAFLQWLVAPVFPMTLRLPGSAYAQIPLVAVAAALVAGAAGTRHAINTPATEAFA